MTSCAALQQLAAWADQKRRAPNVEWALRTANSESERRKTRRAFGVALGAIGRRGITFNPRHRTVPARQTPQAIVELLHISFASIQIAHSIADRSRPGALHCAPGSRSGEHPSGLARRDEREAHNQPRNRYRRLLVVVNQCSSHCVMRRHTPIGGRVGTMFDCCSRNARSPSALHDAHAVSFAARLSPFVVGVCDWSLRDRR